MKTPEWITPAVYGAAAGALALAIIGFTAGGWVTSGTAKDMAENASVEALVAVMTPYCVAQSKSAPNSMEVLAALKAANSYDRREIIEKAGWATPLGSSEPNRALAISCNSAIAAN
jgi:alpha/beta superfamily hydrolase